MITSTDRTEKTTVGAIRWDAWTTHDGVPKSIISQVERSLSPVKFHCRAPFFANVTENCEIIIPEYTMEIFEREMEYAIDAGIDYFAYVWYKDVMRTARDFHTKSRYKNNIKMCALLDGNAIGKEYARREIKELFSQDYYMTVLGGRPLMYYIGNPKDLGLIHEDILFYRDASKRLGISEPYAVIMNVSADTARSVGADAVSAYAIDGANNEPFETVMSRAYEKWEEWSDSGLQYVPTVSLGWNPEPRYINQVSWTTIRENRWAQMPTPNEIEEHLKRALAYMEQPSIFVQTPANTLIVYAWNEHDEGGWLCPTIAVDENGNQLYNIDGTKRINAERIDAFGKVLAKKN